jgi:hypothetical protein
MSKLIFKHLTQVAKAMEFSECLSEPVDFSGDVIFYSSFPVLSFGLLRLLLYS